MLASDVDAAVESVAWQLDELDKSVNVAERDPARFHVDPKECASRRAWISATRSLIERAKAAVAASKPGASGARGGSAAGANGSSRGGLNDKLNSAAVAENDRFIGQVRPTACVL